jgi:hypothetical protein
MKRVWLNIPLRKEYGAAAEVPAELIFRRNHLLASYSKQRINTAGCCRGQLFVGLPAKSVRSSPGTARYRSK